MGLHANRGVLSRFCTMLCCVEATLPTLFGHNLLQIGPALKHLVNASPGIWHPESEASGKPRRPGDVVIKFFRSLAMSFDLMSIAGIASAFASGGFVVLLVAAEDRLEHLVE
jgi:hypothetical protein